MKRVLTEEQKEAKRVYDKKYYQLNKLKKQLRYIDNKEDLLIRMKEYQNDNKDAIKKRKIKYYNDNKTKISEKCKIYRLNNKEKLNNKLKLWKKNNRLSNPLVKMKESISSSIRQSFKRNGYNKNSNTKTILSCTYNEFKIYLEGKFEHWMNWDNYGLYNGTEGYGWDIDHIIPISSAICEEDIVNLNHYTNLQPLCSYVNRVIKRHNY